MSRKTFSLIGICAALAAMPAHACMRATPEEAVKALDTDKNGSVSFKEYFADWTKRAEDNIKMLDSGREFSEKYEQGFDYEKQKKQFQDWGKQENAKRSFNDIDADASGSFDVKEMKAYQDRTPQLQRCM